MAVLNETITHSSMTSVFKNRAIDFYLTRNLNVVYAQ